MPDINYKKIGLKCGIEIHQQLDTNKLFCNCPSRLRDDKPDFTIRRHLRAVAGETGEIDTAAKHEMEKEITFNYEGYNTTTCLVECDEEPPHDMNTEALSVVLQSANMLNAKIVDQIQVMRKTVVDGSNTSGFQRTALVAVNGYMDSMEGKVRIPTISIEEDAGKIIKREKDSVTYRLDRLGVPLIEIGTDPDIKTAQHAKEVAEYIGMILRSTGKVKRGLGTIRQDVNVSIKGGQRIEIKGAQDLKMIPTLVDYEIIRQQSLLKLKDKAPNCNIKDQKIDVSEIFNKSESKVIKSALTKKGIVLALKLNSFSGLLGKEVQPGRRVGSELSDRAKVAVGVGGLFHSDELPKYGITEDDVKKIKGTLGCKDKDAFILLADIPSKAEKAIDAVIKRVKEIPLGVTKEVRKANADGTTSFLRPMPGAARMYPETDVSPITPDKKGIQSVELIEDKIKKYEKLGLGTDLAKKIGRSSQNGLFEDLLNLKNIKAAFIAEIMISYSPELLRKYKGTDPSKIKDEHLVEIFESLDKGKVSKESVMDILLDISLGKGFDISKYVLMSDKDLENEIKEIIKQNKGLLFNALIGKAMGKLRGKAEGKKIVEFLKKMS